VLTRRVRPGRVYVEPCSCTTGQNQSVSVSIGGTITNTGCNCGGRGWVLIHYCPECGDTEQWEFEGIDDDEAFWTSCEGCDATWRTDDPRWLAQILVN
jgi:hypothetical protein